MVEKNIQIKDRNDTDTGWDHLFPKTKAAITEMDDGKTVETAISDVLTTLNSKLNLEQVNTEIQKVVGSAPAALDTLQEIASALDGDPDFAASITNSLSKKVDKVTGKGLSSEDFTDSLKNKLQSLQDHSTEITSLQNNKADKSTTYTKTEVDNKITESNTGIVVSPDEPADAEMWFEEI